MTRKKQPAEQGDNTDSLSRLPSFRLEPIAATIDVAEQLLRSNGASVALAHLSPRNAAEMAVVLANHHDELTRAGSELVKRHPATTLDQAELQRLIAVCMHNNFMPMHDTVPSQQSYGLWLVASFFNHSCQPNCTHYGDINAQAPTDANFTTLVLRAVRDIAQGEELTLAYVELASNAQERQATLRNHYGFVCQCSRCQTDTDGPVLVQDQVDRACHFANTTGNLSPLKALLTKGQLSDWPTTDPQRFQLNDMLARCLHGNTQCAAALAALQTAIVASKHHYPTAWPTLTSMYRRAHGYAKAAGQETVAAEYAAMFNATRRMCRGPRCQNPECSLFIVMTDPCVCMCCQPEKEFCSVLCGEQHTLVDQHL